MFKVYRATVIILAVLLACGVVYCYAAGHNSDIVFTSLWVTMTVIFVAVMLSIKE